MATVPPDRIPERHSGGREPAGGDQTRGTPQTPRRGNGPGRSWGPAPRWRRCGRRCWRPSPGPGLVAQGFERPLAGQAATGIARGDALGGRGDGDAPAALGVLPADPRTAVLPPLDLDPVGAIPQRGSSSAMMPWPMFTSQASNWAGRSGKSPHEGKPAPVQGGEDEGLGGVPVLVDGREIRTNRSLRNWPSSGLWRDWRNLSSTKSMRPCWLNRWEILTRPRRVWNSPS